MNEPGAGASSSPGPTRARAHRCGKLFFALAVNQHEPIEGWLFLRYARAAGLAGVFSLSCLVAGARRRGSHLASHAATRGASCHRVCGRRRGVLRSKLLIWRTRPLRHAVLLRVSVSLGCARSRRFPPLGEKTATSFRPPRSEALSDPWRAAILAFGFLSILELWFSILTPENASYDARWRHLAIAEHYVAQGGISRFTEGFVPGTQPQLGVSSIVGRSPGPAFFSTTSRPPLIWSSPSSWSRWSGWLRSFDEFWASEYPCPGPRSSSFRGFSATTPAWSWAWTTSPRSLPRPYSFCRYAACKPDNAVCRVARRGHRGRARHEVHRGDYGSAPAGGRSRLCRIASSKIRGAPALAPCRDSSLRPRS